MFKKLAQLLRWILSPVLVLLVLFEEWGWEPLANIFRRLARLPFWAWVEQHISRLSPWQALVVLVVPAVALFPVKLLALYAIRQGQLALGMGILIAAKLLGTALVARLFQLTEPALMQFAWFATWYPRWKAWKDLQMDYIRSSAMWQMLRHIKRAARETLRVWYNRFKS